ncbi:MAG: exodeoxyribonuclease VII small subunit [Thermodesulfobacteriota bacterium]
MPKKPREKDEEGPELFEKHLEQLRSSVEKMEAGGLTLEESLRLFEEGTELAKRLFAILNRTEGRVEELLAGMERVPFGRLEEEE